MKHLTSIIAAVLLAGALQASAQQYSGVSINGVPLNVEQLAALQWQLGSVVPAGNYLVDGNGCWLNTSTGASGCATGQASQDSVDIHSRYGSGERTSDGSWSHTSNAAGMGVGGTADGCIYTTSGWSNC